MSEERTDEAQRAADRAVLASVQADGRALDERIARINGKLDADRRQTERALEIVKQTWTPPVDARRTDLQLEIKAATEDERRIEGIATTPAPDRMGDIVDPTGAKFAAEIPLLMGHNASEPIGIAYLDKATSTGISFVAYIAKVAEPGALKTRCDDAWQSVKSGLLRGVSIGFNALAAPKRRREGEGFIYAAVEVLELSLVTVPAHPDAKVTAHKAVRPTEPQPTEPAPGAVSEAWNAWFLKALGDYDDVLRGLDAATGHKTERVAMTQGQYSALRALPRLALCAALAASATATKRARKEVREDIEKALRLDQRMKDIERALQLDKRLRLLEVASADRVALLEKRLEAQSQHLARLETWRQRSNG
jgi:HK97 family phage prohead protease